MKQKEIFLGGEADEWCERNHQALQNIIFDLSDPVIESVSNISKRSEYVGESLNLLEIGCGEANRLAWLAEHLGADVLGLEPSSKAVELAGKKGVHVEHGTADHLPFESGSFDVVIFGFCLYLCDREDLFKIAQEADRVLKKESWLVISDFFSPIPASRDYHHKQGVHSFKMDYRKLFDGHPAYTSYSYQLDDHDQRGFTDDTQEWVSTSVLRKKY
jgi:ubiquinone/menaquinone biosynthesis C-methylase UbiE